MGKRYIVTLDENERNELRMLVDKGKVAGYRIKHAQILLALDEKRTKGNWNNEEMSKAYRVNPSTVSQIAQRFVEEGLESALGRKVQENRRRKIDGRVEAYITSIACSKPPLGCACWTLQLIADELVRLNIVESLSATAVGTTLKKTNSSHGSKNNGVYRKQEQNL